MFILCLKEINIQSYLTLHEKSTCTRNQTGWASLAAATNEIKRFLYGSIIDRESFRSSGSFQAPTSLQSCFNSATMLTVKNDFCQELKRYSLYFSQINT